MNALLKECMDKIPADVSMWVDKSYDISEKIDTALKEAGMTQRDLARKMGKRESEVSRWLSGRHNFTLQTIAKISTALGVVLM